MVKTKENHAYGYERSYKYDSNKYYYTRTVCTVHFIVNQIFYMK